MLKDKVIDVIKVTCALRGIDLYRYAAMDMSGKWYTYRRKPIIEFCTVPQDVHKEHASRFPGRAA